MKPKNFPGRKMKRKLVAGGKDLNSSDSIAKIKDAMSIKTKKDRKDVKDRSNKESK